MPTSGGNNGHGNGSNNNHNGNGLNYNGNGPRPPLPPRPPGSGRRPNPYGYNSRRRIAPWVLQARLNHQPKRKVGLWLLPLYLGIAATVVIAIIVSGATATPFMLTAGAYQYYYNRVELPNKEYSLSFETTRIYDRNGTLLYEKQPDEGVREFIQLKDIPQSLIDATLSTEDPTFFDNQGIDPQAFMRALYINFSGAGSSGASTITQQVARLLFMSPEERTSPNVIDRKINEIFLAIKLTEKYSKQDILEKYLNNIYYGNLAYGIQAAAKGYFGKDAKDLNLAEASMLAGLPQLPSDYDPTVDEEHYQLAKRRQKRVLELMIQNNKISRADADNAYAYDIKANLHDARKKDGKMLAPHFVNYILLQMDGTLSSKQLAELDYSPDEWNRGGYDIYTTLDLNMQNKAQDIVSKSVEDLQKRKATNAALVALRPSTGEVLSMVGSVDFYNKQIGGQFNSSIALRQPGSALKPITYATAMEKGWTAATVIADVKTEFPSGGAKPYVPQNFDNKDHGPVTVRQALGSSLNVPAVKALQFDGVQTMMDKAKDMGINFQYGADRYGLTLTLGGGEVRLLDLTNAYAVFDNLGKKVEPISFLKIVKHGDTVYQFDPAKLSFKQVLSPEISYIITNILSDNNARLIAFARDNPLVLDRPAAAKTGTSNDFKDSWTVGYTPDFVAGVWVGNNDNAAMDGVAGSIGGGIIWHNFMTAIYKDSNLLKTIQIDNKPLRTDFERPGGVVEVEICAASGLLPGPGCPSTRKELFPKDKVPTQRDNWFQKFKVGKQGDELCIAGPDWPAEAVQEKYFYVGPAELARWNGGGGAPPTQPCGPYVPPTPTSAPTVDPATAWPGITVYVPPTPTDAPPPADNGGGSGTPAPGGPAPTNTPARAIVTNLPNNPAPRPTTPQPRPTQVQTPKP